MKMLVETYTKENEVVFDNTMGVGSTGLASLMANRQFIGIEKEKQRQKHLAKNCRTTIFAVPKTARSSKG